MNNDPIISCYSCNYTAKTSEFKWDPTPEELLLDLKYHCPQCDGIFNLETNIEREE